VELRWNMTKARSAAELQVRMNGKGVEIKITQIGGFSPQYKGVYTPEDD